MTRLLPAGALIVAALLPAAASAQETRASAAAKFSREFAASDTNKDGSLSRAEVKARIGQMGSGAKKIDPVHAERLAGLWFDRADTNKDGKVTEAEAQALLSATFAKYDADRNGKIGAAEKSAAKKGVAAGR
ncbi:hypothetical protein GCM10011380_07490 [Sphingomonas metalli]|uniref:EF-hand domain-containing protein n=1 Tax=Sphingomonas metalli TaxID=1779358 RepID=A0A916SWH3_9SPHN|nr:EF-hand domain-containing protein [Sphingomonas metalli]GGB20423.1 hypothetical protein GCM10011380_07490 [Sphingomonas metalli]